MKFLISALCFMFCLNMWTQPAGENPANWTRVNSLSDEFSGNSLNQNKWTYGHPWWRGRSPAIFGQGANAFVSNNRLVIRATWVGGNRDYMRSGAIRSKNRTMAVGMYSECSYKANSLNMGSNFWFAHNERDNQNREDEIDVQEAFATQAPRTMNTNVHNPQPNFTNDQPQPNKFSINGPDIDKGFHRYGVWIVNNRTLRFYLDGVFKKQVTTNSTIEPLWMIINSETYNWMSPPTQSQVNDGSKRDMLVDYVRTWRKTGNSSGGGGSGGDSGNNASDGIPLNKIISLRKTGGDRKFVTGEGNGSQLLARASSVRGWEKFRIENHPKGGIALKALSNNKYVQVPDKSTTASVRNRGTFKGDWEQFEWKSKGNGRVAFKSIHSGKWLQSAWNQNNGVVRARGNADRRWETFEWKIESGQKILDQNDQLVKIAINPVQDRVIIEGTSNVNMQVFDSTGADVGFSVNKNSENSISLNLDQSLPSGIYFAVTSQGQTLKFVKE
ncbi:T9SS type A sorting domain-containing protein [Aquimarina agarivorans]|uniref:T9SS type A sorting domain-containing protein n=1 Tax=Aquimarina agarivorans TaxID=980584 RepID=UPI000248E818|nr:T9SS type A sorting domain-containing protein [Aquimarina agarivorans]